MELSFVRDGEVIMQDIDWGCTPRTRILAEQLTLLDHFPLVGEVEDKKNNPALEAFRKAQNIVYDIFNNGFGNRGRQWKWLGVPKRDLPLDYYDYNGRLVQPANRKRIEDMVEEKFTPIVEAAAKEQNLVDELGIIKNNS